MDVVEKLGIVPALYKVKNGVDNRRKEMASMAIVESRGWPAEPARMGKGYRLGLEWISGVSDRMEALVEFSSFFHGALANPMTAPSSGGRSRRIQKLAVSWRLRNAPPGLK